MALSPEHALLLRDSVVRSYKSEQPVTQRVIEAIPLDKGDFRMDAIGWTALDLAWHIVAAEHRFQDFVVTHPEHSPHYEYQLADPENPALHRRSIYRFLVRSQQQPFMSALDCADPSMLVDKRNQTLTPLQALAQLNNQLADTWRRTAKT